MKKFIIVFLIINIVFIEYSYANDSVFKAVHFSIAIPDNMLIEEKSIDSISLNFIGDIELRNGTISILARQSGNVGTLDSQWEKVRAVTVGGKKVLYEKDGNFAGLYWRVIAVSGMTEGFEIKDVEYYSVANNTIYMLHYHCQLDNCKSVEVATDKIIKSYQVLTAPK